MTMKLYTRSMGATSFVEALSQANLDATFDTAIGTALRGGAITDIIVVDTTGTTPQARYKVIVARANGREL